MQKEKTEFVYCYGCSNLAERGIDPVFLALFLEKYE